jgi:hypothetical protein
VAVADGVDVVVVTDVGLVDVLVLVGGTGSVVEVDEAVVEVGGGTPFGPSDETHPGGGGSTTALPGVTVPPQPKFENVSSETTEPPEENEAVAVISTM